MKKKSILILVLLGLIILFNGCVREVDYMSLTERTAQKANYKKLDPSKVKLELVGKRQFASSQVAKINFTLTNISKEEITINEWYSNEPENIILYCQVWTPNMTKPDPYSWVELSIDPKIPDSRFPLYLKPKDKGYIERELPFVKNLVIAAGKERRYFIKGKLNLKSLATVESKVYGISVLSLEDINKQNNNAN